jgi:hypothetical protein
MSGLNQVKYLTLGCVLCLSVFAGDDTRARLRTATELPSSHQSPSVSPSPTHQPTGEAKQPNAVRRFFSWTADQLARPFRRQPRFACMLPPMINSITTSKSLITFCPTTSSMRSNLNCSPDREVKLVANASGPDGNSELLFIWTVTAGTLREGQGREVTWDLSGLNVGSYTATVELNDGNQHTASGSTTVTIALCPGCEYPPPPCPTVSVSCSNRIDNQSITFEATVAGGDPEMKPTYNWTITAGKIISGQGTSKLMVDISGLGSQSITATVSLDGADPACTTPPASCTNSP